jgi:beta-galactosidase
MSMLDVNSLMYPSLQAIERYFDEAPEVPKPLVLCEYIHAMGNGPGGAEDYEELFCRFEGCAGGFVWEWCDHAVLTGVTAEGKARFAYGGDFGEFPHDGNFCMDGLVYPDRTPHTGLLEYKNVIRPARVKEVKLSSNLIVIENKLDFTSLADYLTATYELVLDGRPILEGELPPLDIGPRETGSVPLALSIPEGPGRLDLNVFWWKKGSLPLLPSGHALGFDQVQLKSRAVILPALKAGVITADEDDRAVRLRGSRFSYCFDKRAGHFTEMTFDQKPLILAPMSCNIWRAPTDNDRNIRQEWQKAGYDRTVFRAYSTSCAVEDGCAVLTCCLSMTPVYLERSLTIRAEYRVGADGAVDIRLNCERDVRLPPLPRFGLRLFMPPERNRVSYRGYGPAESYADKHAASRFGLYTTTALENHEDYIRPQENGSHFGCEMVKVLYKEAVSLLVESEKPFSFSISPYTQEELTAKTHRDELTSSGCAVLCLDYKQNGIGSNSCGPVLPEKYAFNEPEFAFSLRLTPFPEAR